MPPLSREDPIDLKPPSTRSLTDSSPLTTSQFRLTHMHALRAHRAHQQVKCDRNVPVRVGQGACLYVCMYVGAQGGVDGGR